MRYFLSLAIILSALWLGISGVYKPVILALGAASVLLVVWLSARMEVVGTEHNPAVYSWRLPVYWGWLVWQIVMANVHIARLVLQPQRIRPRVIRAPVPHKTPVAKVTYANSITLTPGTITLRLEADFVDVHAIDDHSAAGIEGGGMAAKVSWLERGREID
ncbi:MULTISPECIES: Na+/H+ antiporter subunit E [unclassified Wenzhouxiangella]|uniref:Na+/H+ antiporter subunit E n=1 Tax=unclassified Wenzhouxiangella TaxID=2613841 RepID=UPI000E32893E|nr:MULTISPECIES: Na+/H+ antiporter subunit E [unclassified Wenzhouxiangella]RFF28398.1 cation transporter [Wenzhouxiangella sp. 15181]RFP69915.1 cation transporter [Wenzhouxiangella sp. 15190]